MPAFETFYLHALIIKSIGLPFRKQNNGNLKFAPFLKRILDERWYLAILNCAAFVVIFNNKRIVHVTWEKVTIHSLKNINLKNIDEDIQINVDLSIEI